MAARRAKKRVQSERPFLATFACLKEDGMAFRCPQCLTPSSLKIVLALELCPDAGCEEITLQILACGACGLQAAAVFAEPRRGAFDHDDWTHTGLRLPAAELEALAAVIRACPNPVEPTCRCPSHRRLGAQDSQGRWLGQTLFAHDPDSLAVFDMHLAVS
jgi:hypothetical protein